MAKLVGTWNLGDSTNFDEYLQALGVNVVTRKMATVVKPSQTISLDGETYTIKTTSTFKNSEISFQPGVEFDETTADGRKCKTTATVEGDSKIIVAQKGEPDSTLTRELTDDSNMLMTCEAKGVVCTRKYKRAE